MNASFILSNVFGMTKFIFYKLLFIHRAVTWLNFLTTLKLKIFDHENVNGWMMLPKSFVIWYCSGSMKTILFEQKVRQEMDAFDTNSWNPKVFYWHLCKHGCRVSRWITLLWKVWLIRLPSHLFFGHYLTNLKAQSFNAEETLSHFRNLKAQGTHK